MAAHFPILNQCRQLQLPHPDHPEDGHTASVYKVRLQGNNVVSASADRTARIWDLNTQRLVLPPLQGHSGSVISIQFDATPSNDVVMTGGTDGRIIVWRFSTGERIKTIENAHDETVLSLHYDSRYLVSSGKDKTIKLWNRQKLRLGDPGIPEYFERPAGGNDCEQYSLLATLRGHEAAVNCVQLSVNILVSGSGDRSMRIWNLDTGEVIQRLAIHQMGIASLQYNGRFVVSGSSDNTIRIYDVDQQAEVSCLRGHSNLVRAVHAVHDAESDIQTIVSGSYDGSLRIWEQAPGSEEWRTQQQLDFTGFEPDGTDTNLDEAGNFSNRVFEIAVDAQRLVCSGQGPMIRVWDFTLARE